MLLKTYKRIIAIKLLSLVWGVVLLGRYGMNTSGSLDANLSGRSTIIVLDLSTSMNTMDMQSAESRLTHAKKLIQNYLNTHNSSLGLIAFNDSIEYILPPTTDKDIFLQKLWLLHTRSLDTAPLPTNGNKYIDAIEYAVLQSTENTSFIFLSDFNTTKRVTNLPASLKNFSHVPRSFTLIALWGTQSHTMIDANGQTISEQSVGRNDYVWETLADLLSSKYYINPEIISPEVWAEIRSDSASHRILRIAALLLLLSL